MNAALNAVFPREMETLSKSQPDLHEEGLGQEIPVASPLPPRSFKAPCERDIEIYEEVVFAGKSQRQVARQYGISQPRVNQILRNIAGWMADNTPGFFTGLTQPQRLRLLHYNARKKLEYHEHMLMEAWRGSLAAADTVRIPGGLLAPRRTPYHDVRYLREARKIIGEILKLEGWVPGTRVPDPPQDSEYWNEPEEEEQESGVGDQESGGRGQESAKEDEGRLSLEGDLEDEDSLPRSEPMDAREGAPATYAQIQEKLEEAEMRKRELEKRLSRGELSLGSGPLVPEGKRREVAQPAGKNPAGKNPAGKNSGRKSPECSIRDFLRGEGPKTDFAQVFQRPVG